MPEKTLDAFADHGEVAGDTVSGAAVESQEVFDKLTAVGIDLTDAFVVLENEGVCLAATSTGAPNPRRSCRPDGRPGRFHQGSVGVGEFTDGAFDVLVGCGISDTADRPCGIRVDSLPSGTWARSGPPTT
jgi:hypothetical protein